MKKLFTITFNLLLANFLMAQLNTPKNNFTLSDTLRGSNKENRNWWDVLRYDITIKPNFETKEIEGTCKITFKSTKDVIKEISVEGEYVFAQIDLQKGMFIDNIVLNKKGIANIKERYKDFENNETNAWYCSFFTDKEILKDSIYTFVIKFHGKPKEAKNAPWDGGWIWKKDKKGRPFVSVACQGLGASCWFPCKDYQGDEPDEGAILKVILPDTSKLFVIANGRELKQRLTNRKDSFNLINQNEFSWYVTNPINTYCIVPYIGNYVNFTDTFQGEKGTLNLSYWVLDYNKEKAEEQFKQVKPMIRAFEHWFGPYPFYEDGYKLVEAPFLGMEHQSAIAYGNDYKQGYKGRDLSGSDWGLKWDFIIVHESGHEWFANSITTNDIADMWVHEGFTNYSEVLFTEYYYGKEAANEYCFGLRKNIRNDEPIIGPYGVNKEGSGDMYFKASNMIHTIRNILNDDEKFRQILRKMNETFYHKTIDGKEIELFLSNQTGIDLQKVFDQYLRTTQIPTLEFYFKRKKVFYRFVNCINDFNMPVNILTTNKNLHPSTDWKRKRLSKKNRDWFNKKNLEHAYLIQANEVKPTN